MNNPIQDNINGDIQYNYYVFDEDEDDNNEEEEEKVADLLYNQINKPENLVNQDLVQTDCNLQPINLHQFKFGRVDNNGIENDSQGVEQQKDDENQSNQNIQQQNQQKLPAASIHNELDFEEQSIPLYQQSKDCEFDDFKIVGLLHEIKDIDEDEENQMKKQQIQFNGNMNPQESSLWKSIKEIKELERNYYQHYGFIKTNKNDYQIFQQNQDLMNQNNNPQALNPTYVIKVKYQSYFQEERILQRNKLTMSKDIVIGRGNSFDEQYTHDIAIDSNCISIFHAKIIVKYFQGEQQPCIDSMNFIFKHSESNYKRNKENNYKQNIKDLVLSQQKIQDILKKFLINKPSFYLVDLSSKNGSHLLISHKEYTRLNVEQCIQVSNTIIQILEINDLKYYDSFSSLLSEVIIDNFMNESIISGINNNSNYCGLPPQHQKFFDACYQQIQQEFSKEQNKKFILHESMQLFYKSKLNKIIQKQLRSIQLEELKMIPYLKLRIQNYLKKDSFMNFYLFFNEESPILFTIGRGNNCVIKLDTKQISRNHCEIKYDPNLTQWMIIDGYSNDFQQRFSSHHKTWTSLVNLKQNQYQESIPQPFNLEDIIMIGDYTLSIEKYLKTQNENVN